MRLRDERRFLLAFRIPRISRPRDLLYDSVMDDQGGIKNPRLLEATHYTFLDVKTPKHIDNNCLPRNACCPIADSH